MALALLQARQRLAANGSVNRRILSAALTVGGATLAVKAASLVKDGIVSGAFGTGDALDAFLIALALPTLVVNVIGGGVNAALVPVYTQLQATEGAVAARKFVATIALAGLALLGIVTGVVAVAGPYLLRMLASGFSPEKLALTRHLFTLLLPIIVLQGLATTWEAVLHTDKQFAIASIASMGLPLASILALAAAGRSWGIDALAWGTVAGFLLHLSVLAYGLRRQRLCVIPRWHGITTPVRRVFRLYLPTMGGAALLSSTTVVDQAMATLLAPGSVAALTFGNRVVSLVLSLLSQALAIAVLPYFAEMVTERDWRSLRHSLKTYAGLIGLAGIALTALGIALSPFLVRLLFQRGEFTADDVRLVSHVQQMYLLQIPFVALGVLFARLLSALQANRYLLWGNAISFVVNITLDYVLIRVMGIAGIALSTALVFLGSSVYLAVVAMRCLRHAEGTTTSRALS